MVKRILLSLICIVVLLLSACQSPATTSVPAESSTNPLSKTDNIPTPTFTPVPNNNPLPPAEDTAHWKAMQAYVHDSFPKIKSWPLIMASYKKNIDGSYTQLFQKLGGAYLIARQQYPNIRDDIAKILGRTRPDLLPDLKDFFDTAENVAATQPDTAKGWEQQVQAELGFTANSPAPTLHLDVTAPQTGIVFNPTDTKDQSVLTMYLGQPLTQDDFAGMKAVVRGSVFDANTWQIQPEVDLTVTGSITLSQKDNIGGNGYFQINIPVHGAVDWANIVFMKGGQVVGYGLNAKSPLGFQHLMTMRSMTVTQEGRALLPSDSWGSAPAPTSGSSAQANTNPTQLESQMRQKLSDALDKGVATGDITQDEEDQLLGHYDDPQLAYLSPPLRAGLLLITSIKQMGGDLCRQVLEGTFNDNGPLPNYIIDDPNLLPVLQKHGISAPPANFDPYRVQRYEFNDDHSQIILWGTAFHNVSIEGIASVMPHELLAHNDMAASYSEEVFGNYVQALAWGILVNRDIATSDTSHGNPPPIFQDVTYEKQLNNELWLALFNSTYVPEDGSPPISYIGLKSRITGQQTHDQKTYNVLPGSTDQYPSFYDMVEERYKKNTGSSWSDSSLGSDITRQLFMAMFNLSDQESDQLLQSAGVGHFDQTTGHYVPDYSELLFSDVMDKLAHQPFSDEMVIQIAQALHITLDGSTATH